MSYLKNQATFQVGSVSWAREESKWKIGIRKSEFGRLRKFKVGDRKLKAGGTECDPNSLYRSTFNPRP